MARKQQNQSGYKIDNFHQFLTISIVVWLRRQRGHLPPVEIFLNLVQ